MCTWLYKVPSTITVNTYVEKLIPAMHDNGDDDEDNRSHNHCHNHHHYDNDNVNIVHRNDCVGST